MSNNLSDNPFSLLFPSVQCAQEYAERISDQVPTEETRVKISKTSSSLQSSVHGGEKDVLTDENSTSIPRQYEQVNDMIERLFGISFNQNSKHQVVLIEDVATNPEKTWIDMEILEQALFERLLLENPSKHLQNKAKKPLQPFVTEEKVLVYLYCCYENVTELLKSRKNCADSKEMLKLIIRNFATALKQPVLYTNQDLPSQFNEIITGLSNSPEELQTFITLIVEQIMDGEDDATIVLSHALIPVFKCIHVNIARSSFSNYSNLNIFNILMPFAKNKAAAEALLAYNTPVLIRSGKQFADTMFGALLSLSILPKTEEGDYEFFQKGQREVEGQVWSALEALHVGIYSIFFQLLKTSPKTKDDLIGWLSRCLGENALRAKIWATEGMMGARSAGLTVSDAFMLNLSAVMLRLCEPIFADASGEKLLRIDPTYAAGNGMEGDTCLIPADQPDQRPKSESFNFVSHIFYLTHRALDIGFRVAVEKLIKLEQDLVKLSRAYEDAEASGGLNHDVTQMVHDRFEGEMTRWSSLRAALLQHRTLQLLSQFHVGTCKWIVQVILDVDSTARQSYLIRETKKLTFPLPEKIPPTLACIPESLVENLNCFLTLVNRFDPKVVEGENAVNILTPIVTTIIVLMGSRRRVNNPHLRAVLAESLGVLLPVEKGVNFARNEVLENHPHRSQIVPCLLDVFVSIEMTGQSVQFEQKFNYRRPMYSLMKHLWKVDVHKQTFKKLAREAEEQIEDVTPPIFLRFLNLLINDAVYLLDEALSNMTDLKALLEAREAGEWANLTPQDRAQREGTLHMTEMLAKFNNILGISTINTLQYLTEEITTIFEHPMMVDRIAAMLNYFLTNLVGPKKKNLKVRGGKDYHFKPAELVLEIAQIYIHLGHSDAFCLAISQDGRSYNANLFQQAEEVLCKIGGSTLVPLLRSVAEKVVQLASRQRQKEELLADAPEEFLDPIMSTIMTDPVVLPTSHVTVDRPTIARHLLSDQTDPFNRAPLTMDMIKPNDELRERILKWMQDKQQSP